MHAVDFLIVGGGVAGLRAAIGLAAAGRVLILTKAEPAESNTGYAQGGIAAALGPGDSVDLHAADTIAAGDGLCVEPAVRVLVEDGGSTHASWLRVAHASIANRPASCRSAGKARMACAA